jgi:thiamine biosynthesis protein ThiC
MSTFRTSNESKDAVFASLSTLREYAKTGVVTQEFKLFIEEVEEEKIEVVCDEMIVQNVIAVIKKAHPYEEPVIKVYKLENTES